MQLSTLFLTALGATAVCAAPAFPDLNLEAASPNGVETMTEYFTMLAAKVQQSRLMSAAPICDLSKAVLPQDVPLPPPSVGLTLKHIAIGRGTQNYTCDLKNATAVPQAIGALATLFNASCVASTYPDLARMLGRVSMQFNLTQSEISHKLAPSNLIVSGKHYFIDNFKVPFFDLDTSPEQQLGEVLCQKNASTPAPKDAAVGQQGEPAVAWLKLTSKDGSTGGLREVYRVETVGGSAPKTCVGMPEHFEVQYATQYWFYESQSQQ